MTLPAAIEIDDLTVRFDGRNILEEFSMRIEPGEKVRLDGRSGSGKSTLMGSILGFVAPDDGTIRIEGELLDGRSAWVLRRRLAYVPQEPNLGTGSVAEVLERPFHYKANTHLRGNLERVEELMKRLLLSPELLDKDISTLSGGEKQRVALISGVLLDRKILLLDEPTSALDKAAKKAVTDYVRCCSDVAVLFAAHDAEALGGADRVVRLSGGSSGGDEG